jgi:acyl-CoA thioester hydrolase
MSRLEGFPVHRPASVRWADVDMYGHVNNAVYYQWFDSAINGWLLDAAGVDPAAATAVGVVGESACTYESSVRLGDEVTIGLAVASVGASSITYVLGVHNDTTGTRAALGHWVHVYVEAGGGPTCPVPPAVADLARSAVAPVPPLTLRKLVQTPQAGGTPSPAR